MEKLLTVEDLSIHYVTDDGTVKAVNNLSFDLNSGETIGIVGETGAGKTTAALGLLKLVSQPPGEYISGSINFEGENLMKATEARMQKIRGKKISMIFQDPMTSLNPVIPVGNQIAEVIQLHEKLSAAECFKKAGEMLEKVGIRKERAKEYPHQFSGGMKQRVIIAIALACNPALLIADEPTTALDVTIQAQILELMKNLKIDFNTSMIMITHDLGIVAEICDKVAIMYAGTVVEMAEKNELFKNPKHPYTLGLFGSIPNIEEDEDALNPIKGSMPDPTNLPAGCPFSPRCDYATENCNNEESLKNVEISPGHFVRCTLFNQNI